MPAILGCPSIIAPEGRTDIANGRRFVVRHGANARWCEPWKKWLIWDGQRWRIDDQRLAEVMAKETAESVWTDIGELLPDVTSGERTALLRFAGNTADAKGIGNMLAMAKSDLAILPAQLDRNGWLLNFENGTIDLRTGEIRPHCRADFITKIAPVVFQPEATCPRWLAFLDTIMAKNDELIDYLRRAVGYWITGEIREQVLLIFYGKGANGKSVFLTTIQSLMGADYSMKAPADFLMVKKHVAHPTEKADLFGKRLVCCVECEQGQRLAESLVKELTGGDRIRARGMKQDFFEFPPTHKIVAAFNHKPKVRGKDNAIWRRLKLIPFLVTIAAEDQDAELPQKLKTELSGILNWALQGCAELQAHGLGEPEAVADATADYKADSDPVAEFIEECCVVAEHATTGATQIWEAFCRWADASGEYIPKRKEFFESLDDRGFAEGRYTAGSNKGKMLRRGIGLAADNHQQSLMGEE